MSRSWTGLPLMGSKGLSPERYQALLDATLTARVIELAAARSAAFPAGAPHLPTVQPPPSP